MNLGDAVYLKLTSLYLSELLRTSVLSVAIIKKEKITIEERLQYFRKSCYDTIGLDIHSKRRTI